VPRGGVLEVPLSAVGPLPVDVGADAVGRLLGPQRRHPALQNIVPVVELPYAPPLPSSLPTCSFKFSIPVHGGSPVC
jgi:hypothetical protein